MTIPVDYTEILNVICSRILAESDDLLADFTAAKRDHAEILPEVLQTVFSITITYFHDLRENGWYKSSTHKFSTSHGLGNALNPPSAEELAEPVFEVLRHPVSKKIETLELRFELLNAAEECLLGRSGSIDWSTRNVVLIYPERASS